MAEQIPSNYLDRMRHFAHHLNAARKCKKFYPFTENEVINRTLKGWVYMTDGQERQVCVEKSQFFQLLMTSDDILIEFIESTKNNKRFDEVCDDISVFKNICNNLIISNKWELVYVVLEIENHGLENKEKYPKSFYHIINDLIMFPPQKYVYQKTLESNYICNGWVYTKTIAKLVSTDLDKLLDYNFYQSGDVDILDRFIDDMEKCSSS